MIYNHRVRWVAGVNMAFVAAGTWLALRFGSGPSLYVPVIFLVLFSLFWVRDLIFGVGLKLVSDGVSLHWQDGKDSGKVPLVEIRKVLIGARKPLQIGDGALGWTHVRFQLSSGAEQSLPRNIASGLRSRNWRNLKRLLSHIRTVSNVLVEPITEPDLTVDGFEDEPCGAANGSQPTRPEISSSPPAAGFGG